MNLVAFAASNSKKSINKQLVTFTTTLFENAEVDILDLNDYEMPIYSTDRENESGIPTLAHTFYEKIGNADALLISLAEHNGSYTSAYKNIYDWMSRINSKVYQNKPMILLATSPGGRGASSVLAAATAAAPHFGGILQGQLSIPKFTDNFDTKKGIVTNESIRQELQILVDKLQT